MVKVGDFVYISEKYPLSGQIGWSECFKCLLPPPYEVVDVHFSEIPGGVAILWSVRVQFMSEDGLGLRWWIDPHFLSTESCGESTKDIVRIKREKRSW
jgi:hypothetical protein